MFAWKGVMIPVRMGGMASKGSAKEAVHRAELAYSLPAIPQELLLLPITLSTGRFPDLRLFMVDCFTWSMDS